MPHANENNLEPQPTEQLSPEERHRRELISKLGKYAIYAAPFTVMALNSQAATASGPHKH